MPDADHEARAHVEGRRRPAPGAENDFYMTVENGCLTMRRLSQDGERRPMTGFLPTLSPAAQEAALAYNGPESHGDLAFATRQPFTYLASPYSLFPDKGAAAHIAARAAAHLMRNGEVVYSPIVHGHAVATHGLPLDWEFWKAQCQPFVALADKLVVLEMDGWRESTGVQWEIGEFRRAGKPVEFMGLDELVLERMAA